MKWSELFCKQHKSVETCASLELWDETKEKEIERKNSGFGQHLKKVENMEPNHRPIAFGAHEFLFIIVLLTSSIQLIQCGCRIQDRNPCETVCQWNATRNSYDCVLRVIVILPKKDSVEASLPRVINHIF